MDVGFLVQIRSFLLSLYYDSRLQDPLKLDIVISFPDHGFHLRFDPWSQVSLPIYSNQFLLVSFRYCIANLPRSKEYSFL